MMRFNRLAVIGAAMTTAAALLAMPAHAWPDGGPVGALCGIDASSDANPEVDPDDMVGWVSAGPLVGDGTLTCTVKINQSRHAATTGVVRTESVDSSNGIVMNGPSLFVYTALGDDQPYLCSKWTTATTTLYWDAADAAWTTDAQARCGPVTILYTSPIVDWFNGIARNEVDPVVCPVLAENQGWYPEFYVDGDVYAGGELVWDCPPYQTQWPATGTRGVREDKSAKWHHAKQWSTGGPPAPATPVHPSGTITISGSGPTGVSYSYSSFDPALSQWSCSENGLVVTCTPPAAAAGYENRCGVVEVQATNSGNGTVSGTSRCDNGNAAVAASVGPATAPTSMSTPANGTFPWRCAAAPAQPLAAPWVVRCLVRP